MNNGFLPPPALPGPSPARSGGSGQGDEPMNLAEWLSSHVPDFDASPYPCAHCDKSFKRSDVRGKHMQTMHPGMGEGSSEPESNKAQKRHHETSPHSTFAPSATSARNRTESITSQTTQIPGIIRPIWTTEPVAQGAVDLGAIFSTPPAISMVNQQGPMLASGPGYDMPGPSSGFLDPNQLHTGPSVQNNLVNNDLFDPLYFSHIFGWGLDEASNIDIDLGIQPNMFLNSETGPISSTENLSAAWLLSITPRGGSPTGDGKDEDVIRDPFGRKHDTPWPSIFKPKMPDRALTLGGVKASPRVDRIRDHPSAVETTSRNAMLSLVYLSHQAMWQMPNVDDFPDQETLSDFVDLYFERFHSTFPILHKPTFTLEGTSAVLLLAIAAVGATYSEREFRPLAVALAELVRRIVQWMSIVGVACGSREMMLHSEISRASLVTSLRRLHLLRPGRSAINELMQGGLHPSNEDRWRAWVDDESMRRLGWGIYLVDAQISALLAIPAIASVSEAAVQLPSDDGPWEATDAASWAIAMQAVKAQDYDVPFLTVLKGFMDGRRVSTSDFGRSIIGHTLYRKSYGALESLARETNPQSDPSHLRLSSAALYHHSRIAMSHPGLLKHAKVASGKYEPDINKHQAEVWLETWMQDERAVRRAIWHAGILVALVAEFPLGAFAEAFWVFDSALVFWAIGKYGAHGLRAGPRPALFAANWFDVEAPAMWVEHSGQLILPVIGSTAALSVRGILDHFIGHLRGLPWGMSGMYKQVLEKLAEQE